MKNFFKKLAFVLALAMVVATVAPAAKASAADAPVLNTTSKKLYINGDVNGEYSDTFTLKAWNVDGLRVTFASSDESIATVDKWWGTVTAVSVGTATITATVSNKDTGAVISTLSAKVYVKKNATEVGFSSASAAKFDEALKIGDTVKLNVFRKDVDGNVAWKQADKDVITDYVVWTSSDETVATVSKWGNVTAVGAGTATISAVATQYEGPVATTTAASVTVTVKADGIQSIKQTAYNEIEVTFGAAQDDTKVTASTLTVTPADTAYATPVVKSVVFDDAKTVATVTFYTSLDDKAAYTVAVTDTEYTGEFVASVGEVASFVITAPTKAVEGVLTEIEYVLKDANGVEVEADSDARVEFEPVDEDATTGYVDTTTNDDGDTVPAVSVYTSGKTLAIKGTYYTGDYAEDGTEVSVASNAFVVTGISLTDAGLTTTQFTIVDDYNDDGTQDDTDIDWDNLEQNLQIEMENFEYRIEAYVKDSAGNKYDTVQDSDNYVDFDSAFDVESLDETKVVVSDDGVLTPVAVGTAYVKVTLVDVDKTFLIKVTVAKKAMPASFIFDKYTVTLSNLGSAVNDTATFTSTVKDQYGNAITTWTTGAATLASCIDSVTIAPSNTNAENVGIGMFTYSAAKKIKYDPAGLAAGTYQYKVTIVDTDDNKFVRTISIVVKDATDLVTKTNKLTLSSTSFDVAVNNSNDTAKTLTISYYGYSSSGVKTALYDLTSDTYTVTVKTPDGTVLTESDLTVSGSELKYSVTTVSGGAIAKNAVDDFGKGTYTVTLVDNSGSSAVTKKSTFVVSDSQTTPVVTQKVTTMSSSVASEKNLKNVFSVKTSNTSEGVAIVGYAYRVVGTTAEITSTSESLVLPTTGKYVITKVYVEETFDSGNTFTHAVTVNKSFTVTE